jgi:hypothetical protein
MLTAEIDLLIPDFASVHLDSRGVSHVDIIQKEIGS